MAKARAMASRDDWNEREAIKSATILWYDTEENADSLAQEDAAVEDIEDINSNCSTVIEWVL